jgi:hypothetical protein
LPKPATKDSPTPAHGPAGNAREGAAERMVRFHLNSKLQIAIPADCLEAIRYMLDYATQLEEPQGSSPGHAFRQVIIG